MSSFSPNSCLHPFFSILGQRHFGGRILSLEGETSINLQESGAPFKPRKSIKTSLSSQPNTDPATMESQSPDPKQIFILSGQTKMAGRDSVFRDRHHYNRQLWDGVVPPECEPHPSIHRLDAHLRWVPGCEPLHADIDSKKICGVGPGIAFANRVRECAGEVGLVPCAVSGTAIKEWARGVHLYENMIEGKGER